MKMWELFEVEVLDDLGAGARFTNRTLAEGYGLSPSEASEWIRAYLGAQRRPKSTTRYVLSRKGRTSLAVWTIGVRAQDARRIGGQFGSDVKAKLRRAVEPDLRRIATLNPRARAAIEQQLDPMLDAFVQLLDASLASISWDDAP